MNPNSLVEIPIKETLVSNPTITYLIVISFILSTIAISFEKKSIIQHAKNFFITRERNNLFDSSVNTEWWINIILIMQLCIMLSINIIASFNIISLNKVVFNKVLTIYFFGSICFICLKTLLYKINGWMFFDNISNKQWLDSYKTILHYNSFIFFILALFSVYLKLSPPTLQIIIILILLLNKILTLYKWIKLFLKPKVGYMLFILQFCALEIVPYFLIYKGIIELNSSLK